MAWIRFLKDTKWMSTVYKSQRLFPTGSLAIKEEVLNCVSRHKLFLILSRLMPLVVSCVSFNCIYAFCIYPSDNMPTKSSYGYVLCILDSKTPSWCSIEIRSVHITHFVYESFLKSFPVKSKLTLVIIKYIIFQI